MDDNIASQLAAACSRSAIAAEGFQVLQDAFPECRLIRLSFGLQNKVMLSVTVNMVNNGRTHASFVPIHPTAAAAAVLQNNPVVVVRQEDKRSPLWDQEDLYVREYCPALNVVSMPFYWPPRADATWEDQPLPVPQNPSFHPTFGALTLGGDQPLRQTEMNVLRDLAARTGRHVGHHISMLLSSLEGAGLLPNEADAQEELGSLEERIEWDDDVPNGDVFGFDDAAVRAAEEAPRLAGMPEPAAAPEAVQAAHQQQPVGASPATPVMGGAAAAAAGAPQAPAPPHLLQQQQQPQRHHMVAGGHVGAEQAQQGQAAGEQAAGQPAAAARSVGSSAVPPRGQQQGGSSQESAAATPLAPGGTTAGNGLPSSSSGTLSPHPSEASGRSSGSGSGIRLPGMGSLSPFSSLTFEPPGQERAFAIHFSRRHIKADLAALAALVLGLLVAAAANMQAIWPAAAATLLLFSPYFFDARLYQGLRDPLLAAALLLLHIFLASLAPTAAALSTSGPLAASTSTTCPTATSEGVQAALAACSVEGGPAVMAGFGICWFIMLNCGLLYLIAAPLMLRMRISRALPVQGANLALTLHRLPRTYASTLGSLDTVHVLLLGLVLTMGAGAGLVVARLLESRMRHAWLCHRLRRAADTVTAAEDGD